MSVAADDGISRREWLQAAVAVAVGGYAGYQSTDASGDGPLLAAGGGGGSAPSIAPGEIEVVYAAQSFADVGAPRTTPSIVVTVDDGWFVAGADATFLSSTTETMSEVQEVHAAQSVAELDEPTTYPAIALTIDDGLVIDLGGDN